MLQHNLFRTPNPSLGYLDSKYAHVFSRTVLDVQVLYFRGGGIPPCPVRWRWRCARRTYVQGHVEELSICVVIL